MNQTRRRFLRGMSSAGAAAAVLRFVPTAAANSGLAVTEPKDGCKIAAPASPSS